MIYMLSSKMIGSSIQVNSKVILITISEATVWVILMGRIYGMPSVGIIHIQSFITIG
jgi:hypothetical protein